MRNIKDEIGKIIAPNIEGLSLEDVVSAIEIPADSSKGDYAFPCFKLAKVMHKAPNLIASDLASAISENSIFEKVESVNAYVNMFISKEEFTSITLKSVFEEKDGFGKCNIGEGKPVIVEYSSPNIAKPFHIGHIRTTVIGNSLYKLYDAIGYKVIRMNHLGDYGTQFGKMIVAFRKWGNEEDVKKDPIKTLLSYYVKFHEEAEKDPELEQEARETFAKLEHGEAEEVRLWKWFREESLREFNKVYDMLGISFDNYNGESFYSDKMPAVVDELRAKGLLKKSQGAEIVDLEEYGLTPAVILKDDGSTLYITRDLASAKYRKATYDFDKCIYVVASQQDLHFKQLFKIIELMGNDWAKDCVHVNFGMVSLKEGTLSTRNGRVVFLEDVLNKAVEKTKEIILEKNANAENVDEISKTVGIGAVLFQELSNNRIKDYIFNWDEVLNFDGETGPYVQYTHARAASVLRNAKVNEKDIDINKVDFSYLNSPAAYELIKLIYRYPQIVVDAANKYEPSVVTRHIIDVAQSYNKFYHDEHILVDNEDEKMAKLALTAAAKQTIKNGLDLLGIKAPDKM